MFRIARAAAFAAVALFAARAAAQSADAGLLAQAVATTQNAKIDYAFDFDLDTSKQNWRARFDPDMSPKLRLLAPRREDLPGDARQAFDRMASAMEGVSWCASETIAHVGNVQLLSENAESATYAFQPTPESIRGEQAGRFAARLRGEMTITKIAPDITRVRLYAPEAFDPFPLVRVDHVNIVITCATAPNGRRYGAQTVTDLRGSALGQRFNEHSVQRTRNLTAS